MYPSIHPSIHPELAGLLGEMDERMNRQTNGGQTDGWTDACILQDIVPFGSAAQKGCVFVREKQPVMIGV